MKICTLIHRPVEVLVINVVFNLIDLSTRAGSMMGGEVEGYSIILEQYVENVTCG